MKAMPLVFMQPLNLEAVNISPGVLTFPAQGLTSTKTKTDVVKTHHAAVAVRNLVTQCNSPINWTNFLPITQK